MVGSTNSLDDGVGIAKHFEVEIKLVKEPSEKENSQDEDQIVDDFMIEMKRVDKESVRVTNRIEEMPMVG